MRYSEDGRKLTPTYTVNNTWSILLEALGLPGEQSGTEPNPS